jgi:hypothetical protein
MGGVDGEISHLSAAHDAAAHPQVPGEERGRADHAFLGAKKPAPRSTGGIVEVEPLEPAPVIEVGQTALQNLRQDFSFGGGIGGSDQELHDRFDVNSAPTACAESTLESPGEGQ